ncbi:MAG: purine-nucleoside phosphorylase [bacterium]
MTTRLAKLSDSWRDRVTGAVNWLQPRGFSGRVGLILGSGLGNFVDAITDQQVCEYTQIPGFTTTTVAEHEGRLVVGQAAGVPVLVMQGRLHPYEGLPAAELLLPTATLACLGIDTAVVTNAAGGLNRNFVPGDLMVIRDQLDMHLTDPLRGLLDEPVDEGRAAQPRPLYDERLARELADAGASAGLSLFSGTYASMYGPAYETRAEIGFLRRAGCDAVGMSTAPETVLLSRLGVAVAGLSCITNPAREVGQPELSHEDVVAVGRLVQDSVANLLLAFLPRI